MLINILGETDKRPVTYALLKILQEFGDVLYISNESHVLRLADTRQSTGHYQNVMVAFTEDGYDDFFLDFSYTKSDFDNIIVEGLSCMDADVTIFVEGMVSSTFETLELEYIDNLRTFQMFKKNLYSTATVRKVEEFEACADMCPMPENIVTELLPLISTLQLAPLRTLRKIALRNPVSGIKKPMSVITRR